MKKLGGPFQTLANWQTRYCKLYPNRLELHSDAGKPELIFMDQIEEINSERQQVKELSCIIMKLKNERDSVKITLGTQDEIAIKEWLNSLCNAHKESVELMASMARKATKIYGSDTRTGGVVGIQSVGSNFSNLGTAGGGSFNGPNLVGSMGSFPTGSSPLTSSTPLSNLTSAPSPISSHHLHQQSSSSAVNNNLVLSPNQNQLITSPIAPSHLANLGNSTSPLTPNTSGVAPSILNRNSNW